MLYAQQARLRQEASRFQPKRDGASESSSPQPVSEGLVLPSRQRAAIAVTGGKAATRLDQIRDLQCIAAVQEEHSDVRGRAAEALTEIDRGGKVAPRWQEVKIAHLLVELDQTATSTEEPDQIHCVAAEAALQARATDAPAAAFKQARHGIVNNVSARRWR